MRANSIVNVCNNLITMPRSKVYFLSLAIIHTQTHVHEWRGRTKDTDTDTNIMYYIESSYEKRARARENFALNGV